MPDAYISNTTLSNLVREATDLVVRQALRHSPCFRTVADVVPVAPDHASNTVSIYTAGDLAAATTPLSELTDPDFVALTNPTATTITMNEYGNVGLASFKIRGSSFSSVPQYQSDQIAYNIVNTLDVLVATVLNGATNRLYAGGTDSTGVTSQTNLTSAMVRNAVAKLRANAAPPRFDGAMYAGFIHPYVSVDLRAESGAAGWRQAHIYAAPDVLWPGMIGDYEGVSWIESARVPTQDGGDGTDAGSGADTDYTTFILGKQALAEAVIKEPQVEVGVVPDRLNRFFPLGWHGQLGWALFRQSCIYALEAGASING